MAMSSSDDEEFSMDNFRINPSKPRFFESPIPEVHQLVMVKVTRVAETSAYVELMEYADMEGMILFSEVSTRRIRSMLKEIRAGQYAVCLVLRVDKKKGYVDLSRRRVNAEERGKCLARYASSKLVQSVIRQLSNVHNMPVEEMCEKISWPLYRKFPHALTAFKEYINDPSAGVLDEVKENVIPAIFEEMCGIVQRKLTPQAIKVKAKIEVCCYEEDGIDAVKAALMAGFNTEEKEDGMGKIEIKVVAPPHYEVSTQSMGKEAGVRVIQASLDRIETKILEYGGLYVATEKPAVVDAVQDEIIAEDVASENEESDAESEEMEGMGEIDVTGV